MRQQPLFIATRFHPLGGKDLGPDSSLDPGVQAIWKKALELGLIIELHMDSTYAHPVANMLRQYPESTVVVDHLAGLNHFARDEPHYLSARPFTRRVIAEFGPDQLVWGSDTPGIVDAHMPEFSEQDRLKVKGGNLVRLLGFE